MPLESERFIKSYSSLIESPIWPDDGLFKLYHYCLYKASRNVYLWRGIQIQPGEFPMSYRHAAADFAGQGISSSGSLPAWKKPVVSACAKAASGHWCGLSAGLKFSTQAVKSQSTLA